MAEAVSADFVRQVRLALEVLGGQSSMSPTNEFSALGLGGISSYALLERRGDDQDVNVSAGDHLEFNNGAAFSGVSVSSGGAQDQASGLIELESAGVWLLVCWLSVDFSANTGSVNVVWRNNTAAALLSRSEARIVPPTNTGDAKRNQICATIIDVATPVQVEVRLNSAIQVTRFTESDSSGIRALILKRA